MRNNKLMRHCEANRLIAFRTITRFAEWLDVGDKTVPTLRNRNDVIWGQPAMFATGRTSFPVEYAQSLPFLRCERAAATANLSTPTRLVSHVDHSAFYGMSPSPIRRIAQNSLPVLSRPLGIILSVFLLVFVILALALLFLQSGVQLSPAFVAARYNSSVLSLPIAARFKVLNPTHRIISKFLVIAPKNTPRFYWVLFPPSIEYGQSLFGIALPPSARGSPRFFCAHAADGNTSCV